VRLARPRRPKIIYSPSYAVFRSRVNTTRGLDFDHMIVKKPKKTKIPFDVLNAKELMQKL
jgi:hypothetical protein